jgi:hypothetical protein
MASVVQICNMALSHIGSEARVSSISPPDGSVEAGHCATFYDLARTELLEPGNWAFSLKRAALAQLEPPTSGWAFAYVLPSDCLRALRILQPSIALTVFTQDLYAEAHSDDRASAQFDIEGATLFTNQPDAVLLYVADGIDTTKFPPSFTAALSYNLAHFLAGPIIKGNEGVKTGDAMRQRAMSASELAATASANASHAQNDGVQTSLTSVRS